MTLVLALPEFGLILLAGLILVVTTLVGVVIVYPLAKNLSGLPFGLGAIGDALSGFWHTLVDGIQAQLDVQVRNISDLVDFASGMLQATLNAVTTTSEWLGIQAGIALNGLHDLAGEVVTQGANLLQLVQTTVQNLADLAAKVDAFIASVVSNVLHAVAKQIAETTSALHAAVVAEIRAVTVPLHQFIAQVRDNLEASLQTETSRAVTAEADLHGQVIGARTAVEAELEAVRKAILRKLGTTEGTLEGQITDILDVIGTVAAGTTLVGLIEGIATEVTTMERECVTPTCSFLGPQLDVLNALMSAGTIAAFGGLVALAVQNPKGAADLVVDGANVVESVASPIFSTLTGLAA